MKIHSKQVTLSLRTISYVVTMTLNFNRLLPAWHHSYSRIWHAPTNTHTHTTVVCPFYWDNAHELTFAPHLPIQQRLEYKICLLIFKCLHQMAPVYLTVMSDPVSASASRSHLRSTACSDLAVPRSRTTTYGQRSFSVSGPSLELVAALCSWPISDNDAVLHTFEDFSVLPGILYLA